MTAATASSKWPDEYWPKDPEPPNAHAWQKSVEQIGEDRKTFEKLMDSVDDSNLIKPFRLGQRSESAS